MSEPHPFLKWVGGKRQLLYRLMAGLPDDINAYYEPFLGGGAMFFAFGRRFPSVLSDQNRELIITYRAVRDHCSAVLDEVKSFPNTPEFFQKARRALTESSDDVEKAAIFLYLNRTAFNGLYRVNKAGQFNVPYGKYKRVIFDEENIRSCSKALSEASLYWGDFVDYCILVGRGGLVYFDPPYIPLSQTSSFTSYTSSKFGDADQVGLRDLADKLRSNGVHVMLSNSDTPRTRELYKSFHIETVPANRRVNCKAEGRGPVNELIIRSWKP